jgi:hypothetical protein
MRAKCDLSKSKYYKDKGVRFAHTLAGSPSRERNDCGVIALSVVLDIPYKLSHAMFKAFGRKFRSYAPWEKFRLHGPLRWQWVGSYAPVTIKEFIRRYPKGRYFVILRPKSRTCHALAIADGTVYDCGTNTPNCRVALAWKCSGFRKNYDHT